MLKRISRRIKVVSVYLFVSFMAGNLFGSYGSYVFISKDCAVMQTFRIGDIAYSCKRLAP
jgi:hypothetical protein